MKKLSVDLIRQVLKDAHQTYEDTMKGVNEKVLHWKPKGKALPISALYVHGVVSEDMLLNGVVRKKERLLNRKWSMKVGLNLLHPEMDKDWEKNYTKWVKQVRVNLTTFKKYAQAVYKETDAYLASLSDKDILTKEVDLSMWGMKGWTIGRFVLRYLVGHIDNLTGEISAVKGLQDLKGYPF